MQKLGKFWSTMFGLVASVVMSSTCARGTPVVSTQQAAPPKPSVSIVRKHFQSAIDSLAAKWHIAIIAESAPIMETVGADLSASLLNETADKAVVRIAAAFDYTSKRRDNVFILNKLFTDPDDLPDLTLEQASAALDDISKLLQTSDTPATVRSAAGSAPIYTIASLLTNEQFASLDKGGIPIATMTQDQRSETWRLAVDGAYSGPIYSVKATSLLLRSIQAKEPQFGWNKVADKAGDRDEFGFDVVNCDTQRTVFILMSHPDNMKSDINMGVSLFGFNADESLNLQPDATAPAFDSTAPNRIRAGPNTEVRLADLETILNARTDDHTKCSVDKEFKNMVLTVAQPGYAQSSRILSAVAELYGLQVRHKNDGSLILARPITDTVTGFESLNRAILTVVPISVRRYVDTRLGIIRAANARNNSLTQPGRDSYFDMGRKTYISALRQVRAIVQPLVVLPAVPRIGLSALSPASRRQFAVSQVIETFLNVLQVCSCKLPPFITDFDHAVLTGTLYQTNPGTMLTLQIMAIDRVTGELVRSDSNTGTMPGH